MKTINLDTYFMKTSSHMNNGYASLFSVDGEEVTLNGTTGGIDAYSDVPSWNSNNDYNMAVRILNNGHCIINGGVYKAGYETVYVNEGTVDIYGGFFFSQTDPSRGNKHFEINCQDANYKKGTAVIRIYGGKFAGFDPEHNASESTGMTTNFCADGYHSVLTDETFKFLCKDTTNELYGQVIEMPVYEVVPNPTPNEEE